MSKPHFDQKTKEWSDKPADMPIPLAECILGRDDWPLPEIQSVIRSPVLSPSGQIVLTEGYHSDHRQRRHGDRAG